MSYKWHSTPFIIWIFNALNTQNGNPPSKYLNQNFWAHYKCKLIQHVVTPHWWACNFQCLIKPHPLLHFSIFCVTFPWNYMLIVSRCVTLTLHVSYYYNIIQCNFVFNPMYFNLILIPRNHSDCLNFWNWNGLFLKILNWRGLYYLSLLSLKRNIFK